MYSPDQNYSWNPLTRHRNLPCPCMSGQKIKRCHGKFDTIHVDDLPKVKDYLRKLAEHGFIKAREKEIS